MALKRSRVRVPLGPHCLYVLWSSDVVAGKVYNVAKQKRGIWEELVEIARQLLEKIDEALNPERKEERKLARVPVPVRNNPPQQADLYD